MTNTKVKENDTVRVIKGPFVDFVGIAVDLDIDPIDKLSTVWVLGTDGRSARVFLHEVILEPEGVS